MLDNVWRDLLRMYEGVPKNPVRNTPIENAPNIEVTLGAIASDSIYAQMVDLVYTPSTLVSVNSTNNRFVQHSKDLQRFSEIVKKSVNVRPASEHFALDHTQLGTACYYIPWVDSVKKTRSRKILRRGPHVFSIPIEDLLVPGGSYEDIQTMPWCAIRTWYPKSDLMERMARRGWNISNFKPAGNKDWVRSRRETLGHTLANSKRTGEIYEVFDTYCYFDIDGDGIDEDLLVIFDRTSQSIALITYNPFDYRPIEVARYQLRAHLFYGLGVLEMIKPYEEETTEIHNARTTNMHIANARIWKAREGSGVDETMKIWPNKVVTLSSPDDLQPEQMGDIYPSAPQAEAITTTLAERRTGVHEMQQLRPSQVIGSRTPATTTLSVLQNLNRRFTPAFDAYRIATAGAIKQCLYRYQERLLSNDKGAEEYILRVMGEEAGMRVVEILRDDQFDEEVKVEVTATSATVNKDADRQNALLLVNILATYYQRTLELVAVAANPQTPEPVREVARKIAHSAGEIIERTIRTFDQVRDPETFIVEVDAELDQIDNMNQEGLLGLQGLIQSMGQGTRGEFPGTEAA